MNREIKFRAKVNGKYIYSDSYIDLAFYFDATKNYEQEQYTGLKDKNGKEIYEGDFDKDYQVVRWCDKKNGWAMSIFDFPTKEHILCHCYDCEGNYDISETLTDFEIFGNIYENPELIN